VLILGIPEVDGNPVLVSPDDKVPLGGELYYLTDSAEHSGFWFLIQPVIHII